MVASLATCITLPYANVGTPAHTHMYYVNRFIFWLIILHSIYHTLGYMGIIIISCRILFYSLHAAAELFSALFLVRSANLGMRRNDMYAFLNLA